MRRAGEVGGGLVVDEGCAASGGGRGVDRIRSRTWSRVGGWSCRGARARSKPQYRGVGVAGWCDCLSNRALSPPGKVNLWQPSSSGRSLRGSDSMKDTLRVAGIVALIVFVLAPGAPFPPPSPPPTLYPPFTTRPLR